MRSVHRSVAPVIAAIACALGAGTLAACTDEPERSAAAFCSELERELPGLEGPTEPTEQELDALAERYDDLAALAPLAIQTDWDQITELVHTAVTVEPTDGESVQTLIDASYRTERAARRVAEWASTTCGLTMPAVIGLEGTTTTVAPESTPAP